MKHPLPGVAAARACAMIAALACAASLAAASSDVVISQFYTYGGMSGAAFKHDYVELFNRGATPVDVTGWSIQHKYPMIFEWFKQADLSGTIAPGRYYLVQLTGSTAGNGADLPVPDAIGPGGLSSWAGSLVLFTLSANQFFCQQADLAADRVDYGTSSCPEGTAMASLTVDVAALRGAAGCADTDDNSADFSTGAPAPRNSGSPPNACSAVDVPPPAAQASVWLGPARPDPSTIRTEFAFSIARDGPVRLEVFDLRGRRVATLVNGWWPAGAGRASWDGVRDDGTAAPAGVYFVRLAAREGPARDTRRFARVR